MTDEQRPIVPLDFNEPEGIEGEVEAFVDPDTVRPQEVQSSEPKIPDTLPILPIRNTVVFPGTIMPLQINRERSQKVLDVSLSGNRLIAVVAQRDAQKDDPGKDDLFGTGTACWIVKLFKMSDGSETIIVHGLRRVQIQEILSEEGYWNARVLVRTDPDEITTERRALMHSVLAAADSIIALSPNLPAEARQVLHAIEKPGGLADFLAANLSIAVAYKQEILETFDVTERLRKINLAAASQLEVVQLSSKIQQQVSKQVDQTQREYYLREQMKAIRAELGESSTEQKKVAELTEKIKAAKMPATVEAEAMREVGRFEQIPAASPEYGMTLDYLEWLVELPWSKSTEDNLDLKRAAEVLDEDHYGLTKVKKRILEFLAVRTLKKDSRGSILCFAGPPGVGKTSLGKSIARAMGRNFIRMSLGGIHDEAAIRGHRRTYIGSIPGQIIREIRRAGSNNPLFMLDEVDKIGSDFRGDPMSALLEVLDPAQNFSFMDQYLGLPFDLSKVFFISTANYMANIEPALRDRMEIIEIPGYTQREKLMIAKQFLLPRQRVENGLTPEQLSINDELLMKMIEDYTREAGVRSLERQIAAICRARAASIVRGEKVSPELTPTELRTVLGPALFESEVAATATAPGVVTGLAVTGVGGEIMFIEATKMPGRGQLTLTGQLGDVMRESAIAASAIIRSRAARWKLKPRVFREHDIHIHVPSGAIPKDGPSAGVAMLTAMLSVFTDRKVDPKLGMTGEITLSGRVMSIGGVRDKLLAAHRAGLHTVILPASNAPQLEEVPADVREKLKLVLVKTIDEVLEFALGRWAEPAGHAAHSDSATAKRVGRAPTAENKKGKSHMTRGRKKRAVGKSTRSARRKVLHTTRGIGRHVKRATNKITRRKAGSKDVAASA